MASVALKNININAREKTLQLHPTLIKWSHAAFLFTFQQFFLTYFIVQWEIGEKHSGHFKIRKVLIVWQSSVKNCQTIIC